MSGDLNAPGPGGDEPGIDPRLRAALDHAPDGDLRPPPTVRAAVLAAAHEARRPAAAPTNGWRRWWAVAMAPRTLATAASVTCVGIALKLAWPEPEWLAETAEVRKEVAAPALRHDAPAAPAAAPQGTAAPSADAVSDAPPPAPAAAVPAPVARGLAQDAREKGRVQDRGRRIEPVPPGAARPPAPTTTTTATVEPVPSEPSLQPAPVRAPAPAPAPMAAPAAPAEAVAPEEQRAAKALAADAQARSRSALAEVAPASVAKPAQPGHPSALARWAQALASPTDDTAQPPAGWQLRRGGEAVAWRPAHRAWWQALLAGSAGRWALAPATPAPGDTGRDTWHLQAPDGPAFSLRVERGQLWLQAEGGTWRAPRPEGLPDAP